MPGTSVCVIGAGPSGLVAAKLLGEREYDVTVFEAGSEIGGTFANKTYEDGRLVSSKYLTPFSDLRMDEHMGGAANHPTVASYLEYLRRYCDAFALWPLLRFGHAVEAVRALGGDGDGYAVRVRAPDGRIEERTFDLVAVCSGLHNVPRVPTIPGLDTFTGEVFHSSAYRRKETFRGKRVVIVGTGETAMDLVFHAVQVAETVTLSVRRGFLSVPAEGWGGVPLDTIITNAFEHSHEHPLATRWRLKWRVTTLVIRLMFVLSTGTSRGYNQWAGTTWPIKRGYHILNKSTAAMPYINRPLKSKSWLRFIFNKFTTPWLEPTVPGVDCHTKPPVASVRGSTIIFADGSEQEADTLVLATGYRQMFPFLDAENLAAPGARAAAGVVDGTAKPPAASVPSKRHAAAAAPPPPRAPSPTSPDAGAAPATDDALRSGPSTDLAGGGLGDCATGARSPCAWRDEAPLPAWHFTVSPKRRSLAFIGFVRPNVGAIPPMAELQVMWWLRCVQGKLAREPTSHAHDQSYMLLGRKLPYGVDYGSYMHVLAEDIGAAPRAFAPTWLALRPRVLIAWALGQAYPTFFRLSGPFASPDQWAVARTELWGTVARRGLGSNLTLGLTVGFFGMLSGALYLVDAVVYAAMFVPRCVRTLL
ncbi:hypothetical protein KFE25_007901 [Diacronema lutheri]|uniref:Flavin-containing monooxygenase n=1 Tax=Diacronema lutheri TaxID=2081491 RepID=A0A8J6C9H6_DIALT|nr:hypothetical protein KFE25_007901 [Diacronema lutheri]